MIANITTKSREVIIFKKYFCLIFLMIQKIATDSNMINNGKMVTRCLVDKKNITVKISWHSIKNIIGYEDYHTHQKLIESSFKEKNFYLNENQIDYYKVLEILKNEGLLHLKLEDVSEIEVTFKFIGNKFKALKNSKDILSSLGYTYFTSNEIVDNDEGYKLNIRFKSKYLIDSQMLASELETIYAKIININRINDLKWEYTIDFSNTDVYGAIEITANEKIQLKKPLKPYLLKVDNGKKLVVLSHQLNQWYPKISFFDKELNYLNSIEKTRVYKGVKIKIPEKTKYIQISDNYSLINIKRGIKVIIKD